MSENVFSVFHHIGDVLCNAYNLTAKAFEFTLRFSVWILAHSVYSVVSLKE